MFSGKNQMLVVRQDVLVLDFHFDINGVTGINFRVMILPISVLTRTLHLPGRLQGWVVEKENELFYNPGPPTPFACGRVSDFI